MRVPGDELLTKIALELGRAIDDDAWDVAEHQGWVSEYRAGTLDLDDLVDKLRTLLPPSTPSKIRDHDRDPGSRGKLPKRLETRAALGSRLFGSLALKDPDIAAFRQQELGGVLLEDSEDVRRWVDRQLKRDLAAAREQIRLEATKPRGRLLRSWETLWYLAPTPVGRAVPDEGTLGELARLSEILADRYCWRPGQATNFVLVGSPVPTVRPLMRVTRRRLDGRYEAAYRFELEIDPAVTPDELSRYWASVRRDLPPQPGQKRSPARAQTEEALEMAAWALEQPPIDRTWDEWRIDWNREHRDRRYTLPSNFAIEMNKAIRRALRVSPEHLPP